MSRYKKITAFAVFGFTILIAGALPSGAQGFKRTMLQTTNFPGDKHVTALYLVDIDAGAAVPSHTHPGVEMLYVLEGEFDFSLEGQPDKHMKAGDSAQIPQGAVHSVQGVAKPSKVLVTYVVEKDKPLAAIVPKK